MFRNTSIFILLILFTSCSSKSATNLPDIDISVNDLNTKIILDAPSGWNTFKNGETVTLSIINDSESVIVFDADFGTRVFVYGGEKWVEKEDQITSFYDDEIIVYPISLDPIGNMESTVIRTELDNPKKQNTMRIFVIGNLYENGIKTEETTGAYIDVILKP